MERTLPTFVVVAVNHALTPIRLKVAITGSKKHRKFDTIFRMNAIKVSKTTLLATLRTNRDKHRQIFLEAQQGYRIAVITELDNMLAEAKAGKKIRRSVTLTEPMDQTKDYDRAIAMLEMSVETEVSLEEHDFQQYVLDEWTWKRQFNTSNMLYSKSLSDEIEASAAE